MFGYGPAPKTSKDVDSLDEAVAAVKETLPVDLVKIVSTEDEYQQAALNMFSEKKLLMVSFTGELTANLGLLENVSERHWKFA